MGILKPIWSKTNKVMLEERKIKYQLLTNDQFIELVEAKDYDTIINCTLPLVRSQANSFCGSTNPVPLRLTQDELFQDYMSIGLEGIWRAAKSYDVSKGVNFVTYAKAVSNGAMLTRYTEFMSGNIGYTRVKIKKANVDFRYEFRDNYNDDEQFVMNPSNEEVDVFSNIDTDLLMEMIEQYIESDKQRTALTLYYGLFDNPMTLVEVGIAMGVSPENVRQLKTRGMEHLQNNATAFKTLLD